MFTGLPDFGQAHRSGVAEGYVAFEQPGVLSVVPASLNAEPLQVDEYLQERDDRIEQFTLVTAGFTFDTAMDTTSRVPGQPELRARPAPLGEGWVRLVAPADLDLPADVLAAQSCDATAGEVLPTLVRLDGVAGELLTGSLRAGLRTLGAVVLVTVRGVAARCPGTLTVDVDALAQGIGISPVRPEDLRDRIRAGLPGIKVSNGPDDDELLTAAVMDRLVTRLAAPVFVDDTEAGWQFPDVRPGTFTWELSEPVMATRLLRLTCDPILGEGGAEGIRRHEVRPLTDGREQVTVYSTLPAMPAGLVAATVRLTAPPVPPARPFAAEANATLLPPAPALATLQLASGEALSYDLEGSAVLETDRVPRTVSGEGRQVTGDSTPVVTPADLGVRLISVFATDDLLELADVTVSTRATRLTRDPSVFVSQTSLSAAQSRAWLAVPRNAFEVIIEATATTRGAASRSTRQLLPDAPIWLDLFSFTDPPWAAPDEQPQVVEADGLRAVGLKDEPDWRFLPLTAGPAVSPGSAPQLSLIEAGGVAMLMVTTSLLVTDAAQEAVRQLCLAAGAAADVRLSPAPFEVEGAAELVVLRDGQLTTLAAAGTSNTITQEASFSTALTGADLATVKRALSGATGLLAVRYLLRVAVSGPLALALAGGPGPVLVVTDAGTWRH
ncbi:hypothetical protein ACIA49_35535 [Kribbella sp. NPDC051587]|uniref:hypothetical protein n=1 Tax=Kribbella sp. NPDC051587 TaxID=3364119 RepID=UPI00378D0FE0